MHAGDFDEKSPAFTEKLFPDPQEAWTTDSMNGVAVKRGWIGFPL
jgi:hypothetical protein